MAERRKGRKKKEQVDAPPHDKSPSKDEYAVAKYLRGNLPEKKTSLLGHKVDYFIASKAIDCLLDSPWATKSEKYELLFTTRESIVNYMDRMLQHKFFHRAKVIVVQKDAKKKKKGKENDEPVNEPAKEKGKEKDKAKGKKEKEDKSKEKESNVEKKDEDEKVTEKDVEKEEEGKDKAEKDDENEEPKEAERKKRKSKGSPESKVKEREKGDDKKESEAAEKKKERKKIKLDMHMEQIFLDGSEVYVWIYDPIPMRTWVIGMLMVIAAVLVCLFPLWPQIIRHYIYYLSIAAAIFLVFIIGLAIIRLIVFVIIWGVTLGKHHLWLLPNLTADVGFFESFWPLYEYEYKGPKKEAPSSADKEKSGEVEEETSTETKENKDIEKTDSSSDQEKKDGQVDNSESEHDSDDAKTENADNDSFEILDDENEAEEEEEEEQQLRESPKES